MIMASEGSAGAVDRTCSAPGRFLRCFPAASKIPASMRVIELEFGDQLGEWPRRFVSKPLQVVDVLRLLRTAA